MKRFYKQASVAPAGGGFAVQLDGKPLRAPQGTAFVVKAEKLAQAVAGEWNAQTDIIAPASMPMTRLSFAAIETVPAQRPALIEQLLGFARTDLVSYRAESPAELVARQTAAWDPLLAWLGETHGAKLEVTQGIAHVPQPNGAIVALRSAVETAGDYELMALHTATTVTGSLTIGLALVAGRLNAAQAFDAAHIDEHFQAERWGRDDEAEARRARLKSELEAAERFLSLSSPLPL